LGRTPWFPEKELQSVVVTPATLSLCNIQRMTAYPLSSYSLFFPHICSCVALSALCCTLFKHSGKPRLFVFKTTTMASEFINNIIHHCSILRDKCALLSFFYRLQNEAQIKVKSSVILGANFISDMSFSKCSAFCTFRAQTLIDFSCKPSAFLHISP